MVILCFYFIASSPRLTACKIATLTSRGRHINFWVISNLESGRIPVFGWRSAVQALGGVMPPIYRQTRAGRESLFHIIPCWGVLELVSPWQNAQSQTQRCWRFSQQQKTAVRSNKYSQTRIGSYNLRALFAKHKPH
jgi:hypothetical protein